MKILITDGIGDEALRYLHTSNIETVTLEDNYNKDEIFAVIVRSRFVINHSFMSNYKNIKIVAKLGTGLDNVDVQYCEKNNINVLNAPGLNANATAEFTLGLLMSIVKNLLVVREKVNQKDYRRNLYYGRELKSLKVGIIGYGNIGKLLHKKIENLVSEVYINSRKLDLNNHKSIDELLSDSDIVILSLSLQGNENLVNSKFLEKFKKNAILINIARGGLIFEKDMIDFLEKNKEFIYCTDVLEKEPQYNLPPELQSYENKMFTLGNFIYTPHIAGMTCESQQNISNYISKEIVKRLLNG